MVSNSRVSNKYFEQIVEPFELMTIFFEQIIQAVRTDYIFFQTDRLSRLNGYQILEEFFTIISNFV